MPTKTIKLSCLFFNTIYNASTSGYYWKLKENNLLNNAKPQNSANQNIDINTIIKTTNSSGGIYSEIIKIESTYEGSLIFEKVNPSSTSCGQLYKLDVLADVQIITINPGTVDICSTNSGSLITETFTSPPSIIISAGTTNPIAWNLNKNLGGLNAATLTPTSGSGNSTAQITSVTYNANLGTDKIVANVYCLLSPANTSSINVCDQIPAVDPSTCSPSPMTLNVNIYPYISAGTDTTTTICYNSGTGYNLHTNTLFFGNSTNSSAILGSAAISTSTTGLGTKIKVIYSYTTSSDDVTYGSDISIAEYTNTNCTGTLSQNNPCNFPLPNPTGTPAANYIKIKRVVQFLDNGTIKCEQTKIAKVIINTPQNQTVTNTVTICNT